MDKYEYKVRSEKIKELIENKKYQEAVKIADTIDWRKVKSVLTLCTISDLYKVNKRFEESRDILLLAYDRNSNNRMIVYSLCELSIRLNDIVSAVEYSKKYVRIAPNDEVGKYVLQYKLYEAQGVTIEERIAVLEELKKKEYIEKWAYELAYLYHSIGLGSKCVEECDELILNFGKGKYVRKAMELKMLHAPLTPEQQANYEGKKFPEAPVVPEIREDALDFSVKPVNVDKYATINLQRELAESMKEVLGKDLGAVNEFRQEIEPIAEADEQEVGSILDGSGQETNAETKEFGQSMQAAAGEPIDMKESQEDLSENTDQVGDFTREILSNLLQKSQDTEEITELQIPPEITGELPTDEIDEEMEELPEEEFVDSPEKEEDQVAETAEEVFFEDTDTIDMPKEKPEPRVIKMTHTSEIPKIIQAKQPSVLVSAETMAHQENKQFDKILSQEYDGQISLAVPEQEPVEKQITGQMSIEDILQEWERMKRENQQKHAEDIKKKVKAQTSEMFSEFDAATRSGILSQLDSMAEESIQKETGHRQEKPAELPEEDKIEEIPVAAEESAGTDNKAPEIDEETDEADNKKRQIAEETTGVEDETSAADEETPEVKEEPAPERKIRPMTSEEKKLFGSFIQTRSTRDQIVDALDRVSLASYAGNILLTGEPGMDSVKLARNLIREVQITDSNFSGKMAKITGKALNGKDLETTFRKLANGALIIEKAGELKTGTIKGMTKLLEQEKQGIIVILEDTKININKLLDNHKELHQNFDIRIDIEAMDNDSLVSFAKRYALEKEYAVDELGVLALYTRISELQTSEHSVTTKEVKELVDEAIHHACKKNISHFMDILLGKRYDEEDMIILREKDFLA
ncbi:MAG: hypothetical protein MSH20_07230 [Lachnospiraceae bacterium]|nr:hypothetical protein [Lachnospiraceae bacterium]